MSIDCNEDTLDVRDLISQFEDWEQERQELVDAIAEAEEQVADLEDDESEDTRDRLEAIVLNAQEALEAWDEEHEDEFPPLKALLEELAGCGGDHRWRGDWYPVSLINDDYFNKAMDEMLEDIGDLPKDLPSYLTITVDYDALQSDYSSVEYDGVTFWYR